MNIESGELQRMKDKAYRHGIVNAQIEVDLPLQIRALRKQRGWTQPKLATEADMKQPRISNMEKPGGVHFTLETLQRVAEAFDVALVVRFAPFSELLGWSRNFSPDSFGVPSFEDELVEIETTAIASEESDVFSLQGNEPEALNTTAEHVSFNVNQYSKGKVIVINTVPDRLSFDSQKAVTQGRFRQETLKKAPTTEHGMGLLDQKKG